MLAIGEAQRADFPHQVPADFVECARRTLPPHPVICEIGSRDALDGIYLSTALSGAETHIFEPNPPAVELCRRNIERYAPGTQIFLHPVAVSDTIGTASFFSVDPAQSENPDIGFSSMLPINPSYASRRRGSIVQVRITVDTLTLDSYFAGRQRLPDLLWVDVEGAELLVFRGGKNVLKHVKLIHTEVSFRPMQVDKPLFWEVDRYLRECGFGLVKFAGVSKLKAFLVVRKLIPNLPWRWNAIYCR